MSRLPRNITNREITRVLTFLGFELKRVRGSHLLFYHHETGTSILVPISKGSIKLAHLSFMRRIIDERGIASREEFNELLANR